MTVWEYAELSVQTSLDMRVGVVIAGRAYSDGVLVYNRDIEAGPAALSVLLADMGRLGWELSGAREEPAPQGLAPIGHFYLKRPQA